MLIVRYPSGLEITYNTANFLTYGKNAWNLYTKEGGKWIVSISPQSGCVVEALQPCKIENPVENLTGEKALSFVVDNIHNFISWKSFEKLRELKRILSDFNSTKRPWK